MTKNVSNMNYGDHQPIMTNAHTPTPWHFWDEKTQGRPRPEGYDLAKLIGADGQVIISFYGGEGKFALGKDKIDVKNAEFIVHACNAHDDLVAALEEFEIKQCP